MSLIRGAHGRAQIYSLRMDQRLNKYLQRNCRLKLLPLMPGSPQRRFFYAYRRLLALLEGKNSEGIARSNKKLTRNNWN